MNREEIIIMGTARLPLLLVHFLLRGNRGLGKKIYADSCHFSSWCHCFSKSITTFSLIKTRNQNLTFYQISSLRLGFDTGYPHPSLASLNREVVSFVSLRRAQLSLLGVTVEGLLQSWCWLVLPAVCDEVLEGFFLGVGMGARKDEAQQLCWGLKGKHKCPCVMLSVFHLFKVWKTFPPGLSAMDMVPKGTPD